jgi:hypothetical protein
MKMTTNYEEEKGDGEDADFTIMDQTIERESIT